MKQKKSKAFSYVATGVITIATIISSCPMNIVARESREKLDKDKILWQTSFEDGKGFNETTVDPTKGSENIKGFVEAEKIDGDVTKKVSLSSITGSANFNENETKEKLFDGSSGTKFLTNAHVPTHDNPVWVEFEFENAQTLDRYALVSANDEHVRDPKSWNFLGSGDKKTWTKLDSQTNQVFNDYHEMKEYSIANKNAYKYYRIEITENYGKNALTQLADWLMGTGIKAETKDSVMVTKISNGPTDTWNQLANKGWTGDKALEISGTHEGTDKAHSWNVLYDNLDIEVTPNTALSYIIFPGLVENKYDYNWTQMNMAVDLKFTDGTYLSDLKVKDTNGHLLSPQGQGDSHTLTTNQWNKLTARLGEAGLTGKTIEKVLVAYDNKDNRADKSVDFKNYLDDIKIFDEALEEYDDNNLAEYVNILRGTNDSPNFSRGLTAPAVATPHGFNFWVPVTNSGDNKTYTYQQNGNTGTLKHISVSHEPSYWVGDRGNWEFMVNTSIDPNDAKKSIGSGERAAKFNHENETAKAHYYGVSFDEGNASGSKMELSPTTHGATARFTFDETAAYHNVILDLVRGNNKNIKLNDDNKSFTAKMTPDNANGMKTMYVYGEFDTAWSHSRYGNSNNNSSIVNFGTNQKVEMKVATSFISPEQAQKNLSLELAGKDFEKVYNEARKEWNEKLDVLTVDATYEQKVSLYSNLYRMFIYPNLLSENTGTNEKPVWQYKSTVSDDVKNGTLYYNNGFWDTYHTTWAGYELLTPSKYEEMLDGLVEHYNDGEWVPRWVAPGGTNSMVGTSSDVIFGDAAAKGANFDLKGAYQSALKNASVVNTENLTKGGRAELDTSIFRGYTTNKTGEGFSWSMEGYINDYGISQMATRLANEAKAAGQEREAKAYQDEAIYYKNRALNYVNLFDGSSDEITEKWFKGKNEKGEWSQGDSFDPTFWGNDYTETNAYNMTVTVPQDGYGLANLYGGQDALGKRMDTIFNTPGTYNGYNANNGVGGIHEQREAREVKLGQYGQSNQPSHGIIYMYNYASQPWKTQEYVRSVLDRCYVGSDFGQGYLGDEDNGEMSGWYILSALGFFPVNMGSGEYAIGSPLYNKATLHLENGKKLTITADNNSQENIYVQSMTVNGKAHNSSFIESSALTNGGTINFKMGSKPNKNWGIDKTGKSLTKGDELPNPKEDLTISSLKTQDSLAINPDQDTVSGKDITDIKNLFDNNSNNVASFKTETSLYYSFMRPVKVDMLTLTSTKDKQANAPKEFVLFGSQDGQNWVELTNETDVEFKWGRYTRPFGIDNKDTGYQYYKLDLKGGTTLSEIEFIGQADDTSYIDKGLLSKVITRAKTIDQSEMIDELKTILNKAIELAQKVVDNENASHDEIVSSYNALQTVIKRVENVRDGLVKIEAETFDTSHSNIVNDGQNIGGVKKNTWVGYKDVTFAAGPTQLEVRYAAQDSDACAKGKIQVRLDSREGDPLFTVDTTKTGGWDKYVTTTVDIPKNLQEQFKGLHDVYFTFVGDDPVDDNMSYVANVDYFDFKTILTVDAKMTGNGQIVTDNFDIQYGQDFVLEFNVDDGYKAIEVTVDGEAMLDYIPGTNKVTLKNMKKSSKVNIVVKEDIDFNVALNGGTVEGAKVNFLDADGKPLSQTKAGTLVSIQISDIAFDKVLQSVKVNGQKITMKTLKSTENKTYIGQFYMPYEDANIEVLLSSLPTHTVTTPQLENGSIEVVGAVDNKIVEGDSLLVKVVPHKGYKVAKLFINGVEAVFTTDSQGIATYSIESVNDDITVTATILPIRDITILQKLVKQSKDLIDEAKNEGINISDLEKAVKNAEKVIKDETLTQKDVDNASSQIRIELFKININLYLLENNNRDFSKYTDQSVVKYKAVLQSAKDLISKADVEESALAEMILKLGSAENLLVKKPTVEIDGDNGGGDHTPGQGGTTTDKEPTKPGTVATSDITEYNVYIICIFVAMAGIAIMMKKKKD